MQSVCTYFKAPCLCLAPQCCLPAARANMYCTVYIALHRRDAWVGAHLARMQILLASAYFMCYIVHAMPDHSGPYERERAHRDDIIYLLEQVNAN